MEHPITLADASTAQEIQVFNIARRAFLLEDVFPHDELGAPTTDEDREELLSPTYDEHLDRLCNRVVNRAHRTFFLQGGERIGFCTWCTYHSEDGKCFIIDFWVLPKHRGRGVGHACFAALRLRAAAEGAIYFECNTHSQRSLRFWQSLGFVFNGYDRWGSLLLLNPPPDEPIVCEPLPAEDGWQALNLWNGRRGESGLPFLTEEEQDALVKAIEAGTLHLVAAKRRTRVVGLCPVGQGALPEAVEPTPWVEPAFRGKGIEEALLAAAGEC